MKPKFRKGQDIIIVMSELPEVISSVELVRDHNYNTMYHYTLEGRDSSLKYVEAELMTVEEATKAGVVRHKTLHKSERNSNYVVAPPPNVSVQVAVGGVIHNYILDDESGSHYNRSSSTSSTSSASDYTPSYSYDSSYSSYDSGSYDSGSCSSSSSSCD